MTKPDFALTLSFEGIGLLLRNGTVWNRVGDVPLDVPDLSKALDLLRKTASDLTASPLHVKLVLPDEQIKYLRITDPGGGREVQEAAVKASLDGATPYSLDELSYDWRELNGELTIAAVAYETLEEAETFACENRFEPVYFAAAPEAGTFGGEPYFGQTEFARTHTDIVGELERDTQAIVIDGVARPPEPDEPDPSDDFTTPTQNDDTIERAESPNPDEVTSNDSVSERVESAESSSSDAAGEPPAPLAFASRRADEETSAAPALSGVTRHEPNAATPSIMPEQVDLPETFPTEPEDTGKEPHAEHSQSNADVPASAVSSEPLMERATASLKETEEVEPGNGAMSFFSRRAKGRSSAAGPSVRVPGLGSSPPSTAAAPPPSVIPPAANEKERLTIFGARKPASGDTKDSQDKRPRFLGLILTAVLLLLLVGVGAWASIFVDDGLSRFFGRDTPRIVELPAQTEDELEIEGEEAEVPAQDAQLAALGKGPEPLDQPEIRPEPSTSAKMTLEDVKEKYAVTGIWALAPDSPPMPAIQPTDDFYIPSIDPAIDTQDALALPRLANLPSDDGLGKQPSPAAHGQTFELDERGFVKATVDGSRSPDGHMVFAGKPAAFPNSLPERNEAVSPTDLARGERLSRIRPRPRPSGLIEANERATLGGLSRSELAKKRPRMRPPSAAAIAQAVQRQEEKQESVPRTPGAVTIALPDPSSETTPDLDPNATPQAVATSVKPRNRPSNISRIVKRAEQQKEEVRKVAAPATVAPRIPSQASVAKQATVRNAINLRRVNLIGVYGKPANRRALVRLSSGRYKKVKVGDRIDGGRVSAIGDSELRYQKNGRNVTLKMPRG